VILRMWRDSCHAAGLFTAPSEIGAEADVICDGDFYACRCGRRTVQSTFGEFDGLHEVADDLIACGSLKDRCRPSAFSRFGDFFFGFGVGFFEVAECLAEEADVIVVLDHGRSVGRSRITVVGHVARGVAEEARTGGVQK